MNLDKHSDPTPNTEPSASTNIKKLSITRRVSGKTWKHPKTATRRSQLPRSLRKNWNEKLKERNEREALKMLEKEMKEEREAEKKRKLEIALKRKQRLEEKERQEKLITIYSAKKLKRLQKRKERNKKCIGQKTAFKSTETEDLSNLYKMPRNRHKDKFSLNAKSAPKELLGKRSHSESTESDLFSPNKMHPRNKYKDNPPDFSVLAFKYPSFYPFVNYSKEGKPYIDYKNPEAARELTYCLLREDFNLFLDIPLDTLCPPIPSRLNYIHWIEDLISSTESHEELGKNTVHGIDIGTGASCIYPLLGCTLNKNWVFLATDIDKKAVKYAKDNVHRNNLDDKITVRRNKTDKKILLNENMIKDTTIKFSFCMCNPPFYENQEQYEKGVESKITSSHSVCTGSSNEMFTPGGEFQFIKDILEESLILRTKIRWYTSKIGRLETVNKIVCELKKSGIDNYVVTEFCQGLTRRWGIGWSFGSQRPTFSGSQPVSKKLRRSAPPKSEFSVVLPTNVGEIFKFLRNLFDELEVTGQWNEESNTFYGSAQINTWSRAARRAKAKLEAQKTPITQKAGDENLFEFTCNLEPEPLDVSISNTRVIISWTNGKDRNIFESFYLHIKKRLEQEFNDKTASL
ncbi:unnamed protein product [Rhizophagus irregularis]|nr:unnamed protein product [Rhizophagus irregularis]